VTRIKFESEGSVAYLFTEVNWRTVMAVSEGTVRPVERLLTVRQIAEAWACCERTVRRKIDRGELRAVWLSPGAVRVSETEAARYVAQRAIVA
jgi:excisionase family DNA binding protein